jgi:hypothetical protein
LTRRLTITLIVLASLALPGSAAARPARDAGARAAATVTIGPDLRAATPDVKRHTRSDTVDTPLVGGGAVRPYTFPRAGYVTKFAIRGFAEGGGAGISFLIVRPLGGRRYKVIQYAGNYKITGTDKVSTFRTHYGVPVRRGDTFGVYNNGGVDWHVFAHQEGGGTFEHSEITLNEKDTYRAGLLAGTEVLINATIRPR